MENNQEIITRSISDLQLSEEIQNFCQQHNFKNLDDLLKVSEYEMIHTLGLSYHAVIELFGYLQSLGLGDLMDNSGKGEVQITWED